MRRLPITITRTLIPLAAAVAVCASAAPAPAADEVRVGQVTHRPDRVLGVRDSSLLFETRAGARRSVPLAEITALRDARYPELREADEALDAERYAEAAELYGSLLAAVGEEHLKVWIGARRVIALDRAGGFEQAVAAYMDLAALDQGAFIEALMPARFPDDAERRAELAESVAARIRREEDPLARRLLRELRGRIEAGPAADAGEGDGAEDRGDAAAPAPAPAPVARRRPARASVADQVEAGRYEEALEEVERQIASLGERRSSLPELLYYRGRCQAGLDEPHEAALSFMRVVVHYRPHMTDWYVPSLLGAAEAMLAIDQPRHARNLLEEAEGLAGDDERHAAEIERLLDSLPE